MTRRRPEASAAPTPDSGSAARDARDRAVVLTVVLWVPLAIVAIGTAILVAWLPRTPDPVVTHWGAGGVPNGWMSPAGNLLAYLGVSLGVIAVIAIAAWAGRMRPRTTGDSPVPNPAATARSTAVFAPAVTLAITLVFVTLTGLQLGGGTPDGWVIPVVVSAGLGFGAIAGVATWFALPAP